MGLGWVVLGVLFGSQVAISSPQRVASYELRVDISKSKLSVNASIPVDGTRLTMAQSWSTDLPEVGTGGWPALVRGLEVRDERGRLLGLTSKGESGWELTEARKGVVSLQYDVDFSKVAAAKWPAPREGFFGDDQHLSFIGRAAFVASPQVEEAEIELVAPAGWKVIAPWPERKGVFRSRTRGQLWDNLVVLSRSTPARLQVGALSVRLVPMGYWRNAIEDVKLVVAGAVRNYVQMVGAKVDDVYTVVLLPIPDSGAESYRNSFAYNGSETPTSNNRADWGHLIAHEIFHYWNGWKLAGADYQSSQWFQEGFTEYAADRSLLLSKVIKLDDMRDRLTYYVNRYANLQTPFSKPGGRKGPPLYSGGALTAFCWDAIIRERTNEVKNLTDFWRDLMVRTQNGAKPYDWPTLRASLASTCEYDWDRFHSSFIDGQEKLPLEGALAYFGLKLTPDSKVVVDDAASAAAKGRWAEFAAK